MSARILMRSCTALAALALLGAPAKTLAQEAWKFAVFGDSLSLVESSGINSTILAELATAVAQEEPAFVLFCGDAAYLPSSASFSAWTNLLSPLYAAGIPVFPLVGNHEAADVGEFTNFFGASLPANGPPGENLSTYFIAHSNALVLVLNGYAAGNELRVNQGWVEAVLATNNRAHVFAAGHLPAFKLQHADCLGSYPAERDVFWNSLSNAHCRLYFCGHDHFFDHCRLDDGDGNLDNDVHELTVGTGGAPLYSDASYDGTNGSWVPRRVYHEMEYGYVTVAVEGDWVTSVWKHRTGPNSYTAAPDVFSYTVSQPALAWSCNGTGLTLTWSGAGALQQAPGPEGPFVTVAGASSPYAVTAPDGSARFFRLVLAAPTKKPRPNGRG